MAKGKHSAPRAKTPMILLILFFIIICMAILFLVFFIRKDGHFSSELDTANHKNHKGPSSSQEKAATNMVPEEKTFENTEENPRKEVSTENKTVESISCESPCLMMRQGDQYKIKISIKPHSYQGDCVFESNDTAVASVNSSGVITANEDGTAVIHCSAGEQSTSVYVNVVTNTPNGEVGELFLYQEDGRRIHYNLYHQSSHNYGDHSSYMAWHGCATCSTTTIVGAYSSTYADIDPERLINTVEKEVTGSQEWTRQHVTKPMRTQMPLSLTGISSIFDFAGIRHKYIRTFQKEKGKQDILQHLKSGNPVLFEVRKKSNITGKKDSKWTGSVHTMIFLGVYTTGEVLVCDSVNHDWYSGGQRAKIATIDDLMEYMYSCTTSNHALYYKSVSSDGGYIKIYNEQSK